MTGSGRAFNTAPDPVMRRGDRIVNQGATIRLMKDKFEEWLESINLKKSSKKYSGAISGILSKIAQEHKFCYTRLDEIVLVKDFKKVKELLEGTENFKKIESTGNRMYSNALKKYLEFLESAESNNEYPDDVDEEQTTPEYAVRQVLVNKYERDSVNRKKCIEHYTNNPTRPIKCLVCDFNFELIYGERGRDFIHIHHTIPMRELKNDYNINPVKDLIPVCCNCHAMLHRKKDELLEYQELKKIIDIQKSG
jgi:predicted HNH restriction endonuclease